jgi:DegV family protein with EDD domain
MLRIVMDGAGDMPADWSQEFDIDVIPINIHFGEQTFLQGVDMSDEDFYRIADESGTIPKTSQPSPAQFVEFYKRIAEPGDTILSIHVTGKLSGTVESAEIAARELQGQYNVIPVDSYSGSAAMGYMCREARQMQRAGVPLQKILDRLEFIRQNINIVLTLNNLEYARKSGRVKALQAALASLLNVKPIIVLTSGVLDMADRVRTRSRSLEYVVDRVIARVGERPVNAAVVHAQDPHSGDLLMDLVKARLNCKDLIKTGLAISVAANLGPGTVGVVAYPVE